MSLLWFTWSLCGLDSFDSASFSVPLYGLWAVVDLGLVAWVVPLHCLHWPQYKMIAKHWISLNSYPGLHMVFLRASIA